MASPPLLRKKRMLCAKSPLPVPDAYSLCEGGPILPHQLSDAASLQHSQTPQSQAAKFSAECLLFKAPWLRCPALRQAHKADQRRLL